MITLSGKRRNTFGAASGNLQKQIPLISREFPEIAECHRGTINLEFDRAIVILRPDHRTSPIPWHPAHLPGEIFDLLRIRLEAPEGTAPIPAWIYVAHHSDHRKNPRMHEIIAPRCDLVGQPRCRIHIDRDGVDLPYRQYPMLVIP